MKTVANVIVALVALIHIYIVYLEMFLWTTPKGQKAFGITADFAQQSKALAANQVNYAVRFVPSEDGPRERNATGR